jgi:hypothetical protein
MLASTIDINIGIFIIMDYIVIDKNKYKLIKVKGGLNAFRC